MAEPLVPAPTLAACPTALKEWASVVEALGRGEQLVLIRKGGLIEPSQGFEVLSPTFVFYPTFEHQTVNYVRPEYRTYFDDALKIRPQAGEIRMAVAGTAVQLIKADDPSVVERLSPFHIYNEAFLTQRLKWQPEMPLVIVVVRAYRLPADTLVQPNPAYAGCKSWVDLETPIDLSAARPVLDEAEFGRRLQALNARLR